MYGPDISNYQKQFSEQDALNLVNAGCEFLLVGRQAANDPFYKDQERFAQGAGITKVANYLMNINGVWPKLSALGAPFCIVDVERGSEFVTERAIDSALDWILAQGLEPIIYSSAYQWLDVLGLENLVKYGEQGIKCHNAAYDGRADGFQLVRPYGGWTECYIDQYTEKGRIAGIDYVLDLDACRPEIWGTPTQKMSDPISARQSLELQFVLGKGALAIPQPETTLPQDYDLFVEGQVGRQIPAGTPVQAYTVYLPKNPDPNWVGR